MTTINFFVHKASGHRTKGVPLSAMLQCKDHLNGNEKFVLYQNETCGSFYLRKEKEFYERFRCVQEKNKPMYWTHNVKGGTYCVEDASVMYVGSPMIGEDCEEMKAYFMGGKNAVKGMLFCSAKQFSREFEPRSIVSPDQVRVSMNISVPDPSAFKSSKEHIEKALADKISKARRHADSYSYVSHHAVPMPGWDKTAPLGSYNGVPVASMDDIYKDVADHLQLEMRAQHAQTFIQYYKDGVTHVAFVKRLGHKGVPIRGDNLGEVMQAAAALLWARTDS